MTTISLRRIIHVSFFLGFLVVGSLTLAASRQYDELKKLVHSSPQVRDAFFERLSVSDLLAIGEDAAREWEEQKIPFTEGGPFMARVFYYLDQAYKGQPDYATLLVIVKNRQVPAYWRAYLLHYILGKKSRRSRLDLDHKRNIGAVVQSISENTNENESLRREAVLLVVRMWIEDVSTSATEGVARRTTSTTSGQESNAELDASVESLFKIVISHKPPDLLCNTAFALLGEIAQVDEERRKAISGRIARLLDEYEQYGSLGRFGLARIAIATGGDSNVVNKARFVATSFGTNAPPTVVYERDEWLRRLPEYPAQR